MNPALIKFPFPNMDKKAISKVIYLNFVLLLSVSLRNLKVHYVDLEKKGKIFSD